MIYHLFSDNPDSKYIKTMTRNVFLICQVILAISLTCLLGHSCSHHYEPDTLDLTQYQWNLWPDQEAEWENDSLFLPPVDLSGLPQNPPTCGWEELHRGNGKLVRIPATVEEHFWGENGHPFGISGDYVGVSWFNTRFTLPGEWEGRRIFIRFGSVRLRAEVYLNEELVGYDLIAGTPFEIEVTDRVYYTRDNHLAVRITDPNGNFAWRDIEPYMWGDYEIPPGHGFGGITGKVIVRSTEDIYLSDVFIRNTPFPGQVDLEYDLRNRSGQTAKGQLTYTVKDAANGETVYTQALDETSSAGSMKIKERIRVDDARLWSPEEPNLYELIIEWQGEDLSRARWNEHFGFRWFEIRESEGDRQFFLNDRRMVLRSAISWGHWPSNGIYPTPELAEKQVSTAKELGLNMLNFHRAIGQPPVLDQADRQGLLYYEEPGGFQGGRSEFARRYHREKLMRMIRRDRNHPSLVIYNMINEAARDPYPDEVEVIKEAHRLDPGRLITFTSTYFHESFYGGRCPRGPAPFKMHMLPGDDSVYYEGIWDEHHAFGPGVYLDEFYDGPEKMHRHYDHPSEIIFLGEDGAIGTPPRLQLIRESITGKGIPGWDGDQYLSMYQAYEEFLDEKDFRDAFPTVDDLTRSLGSVAHYYQGRIIENFRAGNTGDGYVINGWEGTKVENHSGIVDVYRNPKADPEILAHYNRPLYLAVKIRNKVVGVGDAVVTDIYLVNEGKLQGSYRLEVSAERNCEVISDFESEVRVEGGNTYGELLREGFTVVAGEGGYLDVRARLYDGGQLVAEGKDRVFAVDYDPGSFRGELTVLDTGGVMQQVAEKMGIKGYATLDQQYQDPDGSVLLVGGTIPPGLDAPYRLNDPLLDWVNRGNTLVIIRNADIWADYLNRKEVVKYRGSREMEPHWFGGNYFVRDHPLFDGLPVNTAFNWEYQCLAGYEGRDRFGMRLWGEECVVGCQADHNQELYTAVGIITLGRGTIILSSPDLTSAILEGKSSGVVAKQILLNYLKYGM